MLRLGRIPGYAGRMHVHRLKTGDLPLMRQSLALYSEVFADPGSYASAPPSDAYLEKLLADPSFVSIAAVEGGQVIGALSGYVLRKFEQERSEIYIYDLAVSESHRRRKVATTMIRELQAIAPSLGAWVIMVQADYGDDPAIRLYESLGTREEVLHFDLPVRLTFGT